MIYTCAPHFKRIAHRRNPDSMLNRISGRDGYGCIAGTHYCRITSRGGPVIRPLPAGGHGVIAWSEEAQQRLSRVPAFLRDMVEQRAEAYVAECGEWQVTIAHLTALTARRFGAEPEAPDGSGHSHGHGRRP